MKILGYSGPVVLLLIGVTALIGLSRLKKEPAKAERDDQSTLVDVAAVKSCAAGFEISVDGEVIPFREISLAAQVGGRVSAKSMQARAGTYVRKGEPLFEIDPRDYQLEVRRLNETVKQAGSSIEELDVEKANVQELISLAAEKLDLQRKEVKRFEGLRQKNATSTSQLENVRQLEIESLNSLQSLKNQIMLISARRNRLALEKDQAITNLDLAELNLSRTKIESPLDGVVIQDFAEQDDFVQVGTKLVQLEDTSKVEVRFSLRMDQLRWLWKSMPLSTADSVSTPYNYRLPALPVEICVELDGSEFVWPARLDRYDGAGINSGTRTIPVIAVVDDPTAVQVVKESAALTWSGPPTLLRGSYVTINLPVGNDMNLVSIPATALQPDKTVWLYDSGRLRIQTVNVAYSDQDTVVVLADPLGLRIGDSVITTPLPIAEQGMALRLVVDEAEVEPSPEKLTTSET